ncbi:MAG: glutamate--tRNA ligase [Thermogladius sp.]|nr:glutamate--tRNA ligase [Thermogladius sp.]
MLEKIREVALKNALANAVKHEGKADTKAVVSKVLGEVPEARSIAREVVRIVQEVVEQVNKMPIEEQKKLLTSRWPDLLQEKKTEKEKTLPPLPDAVEGRVVTRFAPNPDFAIHLGNARPALLSYWYARQYKGKFILRFEDTDPRTKAPFPEAYLQIKEDLKWLGVKWDEEYIQSLRMEVFYNIARRLLEAGGAYVDTCSEEEFRRLRNEGRACPHRDSSVEDNLERFDKMLEGHFKEGEAVVRVKTDLSHPDPSVRDWVALRIIDSSKTPHPITGDKYIVWPTYNFAAGIDDYLMGVTHILRAKEHISNTVKQGFLYNHLKWKYPVTIHFGRLGLEGVILSKSKMRKMSSTATVNPFNDLRFGTIASLRRRGIRAETIHKVVMEVGVKPVDAKISLVNLFAINRSIVDPIARRYMAVEDPVYATLEFSVEKLEAHVPRRLGTKEFGVYELKGGDIIAVSRVDLNAHREKEFRLLGLGNFRVKGVVEKEGRPLIVLELTSLSSEEARSRELPIIQWVKIGEHLPGRMLVVNGDRIESRSILIERSVIEEKTDNIIQLYRIGFARVEDVSEEEAVLVYSHD